MPSVWATCRLEAPREISVRTSTSRGVSPAGRRPFPAALPGGGEHRVDRVGGEATASDLGAELAGGLLPRCAPAGTGGARSSPGTRRRRRGSARRPESPRPTGPGGSRTRRAVRSPSTRRRRSGPGPAAGPGSARCSTRHPHPLGFGGGQRTGFVEDGRRHPVHADVMHQTPPAGGSPRPRRADRTIPGPRPARRRHGNGPTGTATADR